ncbi:MAG: hypothetical protein ABIT38_11375 [Gemmatimonadaceae bacterium]
MSTVLDHRWTRLACALMLSLFAGRNLSAQAWAYPSFQPPTLTPREFNFGVASANDAGTSFVFQWRELATTKSLFWFDGGFADPKATGSDNVFFVSGNYGYDLHRSNADVPLDFLFTAGAGVATGNKTTLRIPVGVSIGHRFPLDGGVAITPYVHPRASIDFCGGCKGDESQLGLNFDLGANFELTRVIALRTSAFFGGSNRFGDNGIALSLAWSPPALKR